jgi:hypothetical protein
MKRNRSNKYLNAKPVYKHRVPTTKELGAQARKSERWLVEGLLSRTLAGTRRALSL